jgi:hypothetical protein
MANYPKILGAYDVAKTLTLVPRLNQPLLEERLVAISICQGVTSLFRMA